MHWIGNSLCLVSGSGPFYIVYSRDTPKLSLFLVAYFDTFVMDYKIWLHTPVLIKEQVKMMILLHLPIFSKKIADIFELYWNALIGLLFILEVPILNDHFFLHIFSTKWSTMLYTLKWKMAKRHRPIMLCSPFCLVQWHFLKSKYA